MIIMRKICLASIFLLSIGFIDASPQRLQQRQTLGHDRDTTNNAEEIQGSATEDATSAGRCFEEDGTVFGEGSAMASPHECSLCYCIRGERLCVTPKCQLPLRGCKPRYRRSSCCPAAYDCQDSKVITTPLTTTPTTTSTTTSEITTTPKKRKVGCQLSGQRFFEGQFMPNVDGLCKACYCLRGRPQCTEIRCKPPVKGCNPVMVKDRCCPARYDCEKKKKKENSRYSEEILRLSKVNSNKDKGATLDFDESDLDEDELKNHVRIQRQSQMYSSENNEISDTTVEAVVEETTVSSQATRELMSESVKVNEEELVDDVKMDRIGEENLTPEEMVDLSDANLTNLEENNFGEKIYEATLDEEVNNVADIETPIVADTGIEYIYDDTYTESNYEGEDYYVEVTTLAPTLSIKDLLSKLSISVKKADNLSELLPEAITGTRIKEDESPDVLLGDDEPPKEEPEFFSYDINVGTSLRTGSKKEEPVGIGQVIPIDIGLAPNSPNTFEEFTPETQNEASNIATKKPQHSFLDTFLNLFAGGSVSTAEEEPSEKSEIEESPVMLPPPPPPFQQRPPPLVNMRPPPSFESPSAEYIPTNELPRPTGNELLSQDELDAKPTIENEVRVRPRPPFSGSITRNELPIRRRPTNGGARPTRPGGLLAARPSLPIKRPTTSYESTSGQKPNLPSTPIVEGGFSALGSPLKETKAEGEDTKTEPTLPPSLPNLQIIPFVAADALVNQGSPPTEEEAGFNPKPKSGDCREGGKMWKNGETVAKGDDDPCVLCRCIFAKVICQRLECPKLPEGCVEETVEGDCCPQITCDESLNVSIVDTLPSFKPIKDEKESPVLSSRPIRPSIFAHQNRRAPFAPASNRPRVTNPLSALRKQFTAPLQRPLKRPDPPISKPKPRAPTKPEENPKTKPTPVKPTPRRPIRPVISRNTTPKPAQNFRPGKPGPGNRLRPYSSLNRTGVTRRPFIPPRVHRFTPPATTPPKDDVTKPSPTASVSTTSEKFTSKSTTTTTTPQAPSLSSSTTTTTVEPEPLIPAEEVVVVPEETPISFSETPNFISETSERPLRPDIDAFLAGLLLNNQPPKPKPAPISGFDAVISNLESNEPFILPPDLLLPKPLPTNSNLRINDDDLINFVEEDSFGVAPNVILSPDNLFKRPQKTKEVIQPVKPSFKPLPEIPAEVKAQLPLGNDPILVSGLLELGGCNVYGRIFEIGEEIAEISGQCKACQCTKVGVQCLPIC